METSKIISSTRLCLEPFSKKFLTETYVNWLNDSEVTRWSQQQEKKHTLESCQEYLQSFEGSDHYFWAIQVNEENLGHIGNLNAYVDVEKQTADIGILIGRKDIWGKGYGLEAWKAASDFLLNERHLKKITAGTPSDHHAMIQLMKKAGMTPLLTTPSFMEWNGKSVEMVRYQISQI